MSKQILMEGTISEEAVESLAEEISEGGYGPDWQRNDARKPESIVAADARQKAAQHGQLYALNQVK